MPPVLQRTASLNTRRGQVRGGAGLGAAGLLRRGEHTRYTHIELSCVVSLRMPAQPPLRPPHPCAPRRDFDLSPLVPLQPHPPPGLLHRQAPPHGAANHRRQPRGGAGGAPAPARLLLGNRLHASLQEVMRCSRGAPSCVPEACRPCGAACTDEAPLRHPAPYPHPRRIEDPCCGQGARRHPDDTRFCPIPR